MAEEKKFTINLNWEKLSTEELRVYIGDLHAYLMDFDTSSIKGLLVALDNISHKIADDLDAIAEGELFALKVLSNDKDDKVFDRIMALFAKVKDIRDVSEIAGSLRPPVEKLVQELDTSAAPADISLSEGNVFEQLQERAMKKHKK